MGDVLNDHVDGDVGVGQGRKNLRRDPGLVRHPLHANLGFILVVADPRDQNGFHILILLRDQSSWIVVETRTDVDHHAVFLGKFHAADLQHLGAQGSQLQHFLVGNLLHFRSFGNDPRIGGVDPVDIGVDLADIGLERRRHRHRRGIRTAAAEGGDIAFLVDPLKAGDDENRAVFQIFAHAFVVDRLDPRLGKDAVGDDRDLVAHVALGLVTHGLQAHGQQGNGDLLSGCHQHVVLTLAGKLADFIGHGHQFIGFARHRRNNDYHIVAVIVGLGDATGNIANPVDGSDRCPTVLLHNEGHNYHILLWSENGDHCGRHHFAFLRKHPYCGAGASPRPLRDSL